MNPHPRKELEEKIAQAISFAIQGVREYTPKDITDYYRNRDAWVDSQTESALQAVDRYVEEQKQIERTNLRTWFIETFEQSGPPWASRDAKHQYEAIMYLFDEYLKQLQSRKDSK